MSNNTKNDIEILEAPYKLPEGWKWVTIKDCCETFADGDWIESKDQSNDGIRLIQTGNIGNGNFRDKEDKYHFISEDTFKKLNCTEIFAGDILISRLPEPVGRSCIIPELQFKMITAVDCTIVRLFENITNKKWFCYYTQTPSYDELIKGSCTGTTRLRISRNNLGNLPFPLAPFAEQQRIVNRIESMFAKLDEAKEKAQNVVDCFETRKAAILHQAFTGKLTENWRKENGVSDDSWEEKTFSEIGASNLGKMLDANKNTGDDVRYIRNVNVRWFDFDLSDLLIMKAKPEEIKKLSIKRGDLFICEGGEPGRCAVWKDNDIDIIFQKAIHRFKPNEGVSSDFVAYSIYYLNQIGKLSDYFTGTTIKHLTGQSLAKIPLRLPSFYEQQEIVRILDTVLEKERIAKSATEQVLEQIDLLKKSILARAFRGEL